MQKPQTLEGAAGAKITRMGGCRNPNPQMSKTLEEQLVQVGVGGAETQRSKEWVWVQEPQTLKGAAGRNQNPKMSKTLKGAAGARWRGWVQKPKPLKE